MIVALLFAILFQQQPAPPPPEPVQRGASAGAVYGTYWVRAGETLIVNIDDPVPDGYGVMWAEWRGHCAVNGAGSAWGGGGGVWVDGSQVTIVGVQNDCVVDVKGRINRCTGTGCPDLSRHWAADPYRRALGEWRPGVLGNIIYNLVGTNIGWFITIAWTAGWVGFELVRAILRMVGYFGDDYEYEEDDEDEE